MFIIIGIILLLIIDFQIGKWLIAKRNKSNTWLTNTDQVDVFTSGDRLFEQMLIDIEAAKYSIDMQFFIIRNDRISNQIYSLLVRKQNEGVKVRVMADWVGSLRFRNKWLKDKVSFRKMNRPTFPFFYHLQQRNHRKVLIVDENVSYIGGFNLGDEYVGKDKKLGRWQDYHLRLTGDIIEVLQSSFNLDWDSQAQTLDRTDTQKNADVKVLSTEGNVLEDEILRLISQTKESIEIGSPYFIPTRKIEKALIVALKRGVTLTVVVPDKADHLLTKASALAYFKKMKKYGADIYLYKDGFFHGKVLFFDQAICDFGTANFDRRSLSLNQELNIIVMKEHAIFHEMQSIFRKDLSISKKMTDGWIKHQPVLLRLLMWLTMPFRSLL
ncbi:phospholipase D-like domain-containing protein [Gracilibacillus massiliensis]|uniref:phospholipase D-like domain-containing protein n=1 Tax=Gracilibacillus massiliensis TaxID=1564956 RepID=UPI00071C665D|nr:phospholipase D-like domain-containing protein [Gracilibacillus massiliensis]